MIIGKQGNQNSGVEYGDIRPGLISRRGGEKKRGGEGEIVGKMWGKCGKGGAEMGRGEKCAKGGGGA